MIMQNQRTRILLWHRACALVLAVSTACSPTIAAAAGPTIPGFYGAVPGFTAKTSLPVVLPGGKQSGATVDSAVGNTLTINQTQSQATIDWSSFNIAPGSVVMFNQKAPVPVTQKDGTVKIEMVAQPQWVALNRIYDANPSQIFGSLKADGKAYLINRNGILFGLGSQVNTHSLIASNLNITDENFKNGILRFTTASDPDSNNLVLPTLDENAYIFNYGNITTDSGGSVFLIGPKVMNAGTISSPSGKISLIGAGQKADGTTGEVEVLDVTVTPSERDMTYNDLEAAGAKDTLNVYNAKTGSLITDAGGRINMYGATVQNDGLIRSVTAFKKGGVVVLAARDKVTTGVGSFIESPIDTSTETSDPQSSFAHPEIIFQGLHTGVLEGLDTVAKLNPLGSIEHQGSITAPSGNVTLIARDKIFLGDSSIIDVKGLWLDRPASANLLEVQLNSVDLRDDYGQKYGTILGQKVYLDVLTGSSFGNLNKNYSTMQTSAEERSTTGGKIIFGDTTLTVPVDQLIFKQGARLDFSGGGISYATGNMATSRLISGNKLYDLGTAPQWITYDRVADSQTRTYQRFGVTEEFKGLYFGGGSSVQDLTAGRVVGSNAGSVLFDARLAALDGSLISNVTRGLNQTKVTPFTTTDQSDYKVSVIRGLEEPVGGTVTIGNMLGSVQAGVFSPDITSEGGYETNAHVDSITIKPTTTPLATNIDATYDLTKDVQRQTTNISAVLFNNAGLSSLNLFANTTITTEPGARLSLLPGGSYIATSRRIEYGGEIDIPGGKVEMDTRPNISSLVKVKASNGVDMVENPLYQPLIIDTVYLAQGSRISTAGLEIDNSAAGGALHPVTTTTHIAGGSILIQEKSLQDSTELPGGSSKGHSLVVATGALLDVSGGWLIDPKGAITGGDAGTLDLRGSTLSLAGEVRGYSLPGKKGGEIKLSAGEVQVTSRDLVLPFNLPVDEIVPDYLLGKLVLGEDRLKDTGFSRISLNAIDNLSFSDGAVLTPSLAKLSIPVPAIVSQGATTANVVLPAGSDPAVDDYLGTTSLSLIAGVSFRTGTYANLGVAINNALAKIDLPAGTGLTVAPGGSIALTAPNIDMVGRIEALGGSVNATANDSLNVRTGGQILAGGYNKPVKTTVAGLPAGSSPQPGGSVALKSTTGNVVLEAGSLVDVSGAAPVERLVSGADGKPVTVVVAGDPGTLSLSYGGVLTLDGEIDGNARMDGVRGGTLSVTKSVNDLRILAADISRYQRSGFDDLSFISTTGALDFTESLKDVTVGRHLTLDGVSIKGEQDVNVILRSPWITVTNTPAKDGSKAPVSGSANEGKASLSLFAEGSGGSGGFLDVTGSFRMDGFSDVTLQAGRDIRFSDALYSKTYAGDLKTSGNLTLQAARVYPNSATNFTITSPGTVTILPGGVSDTTPVYSAGGNLTIKAAVEINHQGTLEAPQGSITLDGGTTGHVVLADGSRIITAGSVPVSYGSYDGSTWTTRADTNNRGSEIISAQPNSVTLKGKVVNVNQGATLDVSGGGSVYSALFQPGIPGTNNPLNPLNIASGRFVILPDRSVTLPDYGAVYLDAAPALGLKAGIYSLLPAEEYALVPGALVVQDTGVQLVAGQNVLSMQGYQVVAGYKTVTDTSISSQSFKGYSVRSAVDVLKEGDFAVKSFVSGKGGDLTLISATSATMNGDITALPLQGYEGGVLSLSAKNVIAQGSADPLPSDTSNTLIVNMDTVSNSGFGEVALGAKVYDSNSKTYTYSTDTVTVKSGSDPLLPNVLKASSVTLQAKTSVVVESNAVVEATGDGTGGIVTVDVPGTLGLPGTFNLYGKVYAVNGLQFNVGSMSLVGPSGLGQFGGISPLGTLKKADRGSFSLTANDIVFANNDSPQQEPTFTGVNWSNLTGYDDLTLASHGGMSFPQSIVMAAKGTLTLNAGRYTAPADVNAFFTAGGKMTLLNSGTAVQADPANGNNSSLTFTAAGIDISPRTGGIVFDQFGTVTLNSSNDVTLRGAGSVKVARDLNINAPRVTTSYNKYDADPSDKADLSTPYTAADLTIDASKGIIVIAGNGGTVVTAGTPGGSLEILGSKITVGDASKNKYATVLESPSGQVKLTATGDIAILEKTSILARGSQSPAPMQPDVYSYSPGGQIIVQSSIGAVSLASGSLLDVSAYQDPRVAGAVIKDQGDAGSVTLYAPNGGVTVAAGVLQGNKSKFADGQGGSLTIDSATLDGVGTGGLDGLSTILAGGGFNNQINIRSRSGDLSLAADKTLTGREVMIAADTSTKDDGTKNNDGSIDISGKIYADTTDGSGRIELYSGKALNLESGAKLSAIGIDSGAKGGTVILSSQDGSDNTKTFNNGYALNMYGGVNVKGNGGTGGTVAFRAYQNANHDDVNIGSVGTITGASRVSVEAVKTEAFTSNTVITDLSSYTDAATTFINSNPGIKTRLPGINHLQAGIEIVTAADKNLTIGSITATNALDLNNNGEAIVLTLKSGKDLTINQSLTDARTSIDTLHSNIPGSPITMRDTAAFNLVAGSDGGANYMGVTKGSALTAGTGDLTIVSGKTVYTENASINFAARHDVNLNGTTATTGPSFMINKAMQYNLGSYGGTVRGSVGNNLNLDKSGSAIQTALGDIDLRVGGDLNLASGAIRTTGEYTPGKTEIYSGLNAFLAQPELAGLMNPNYTTANKVNPAYANPLKLTTDDLNFYADLIHANNGINEGAGKAAATASSYWTYGHGGGISLDVGGAVKGKLSADNGWDGAYTDPANKGAYPWYLAAGFGGSKEKGITTNIPVTVGIATMGGGEISVQTGGALLTQIGAFGTRDSGDLNITSGGDMTGRFRIMNGTATLTSGGGFGKDDGDKGTWRSVIELGVAQVTVAAQGDVQLGSVLNPDNSRIRLFENSGNNWNMTYTPESSANINSLAGNVTFYGTDGFNSYNFTGDAYTWLLNRQSILPATFTLAAAGDLNIRKEFYLAPSTTGNLGLYAGGNINGSKDVRVPSGFRMVDVYDVGSFYERQADPGAVKFGELSALLDLTGTASAQWKVVNHLDDSVPVTVTAGKDINTIMLVLDKRAEISAGGDINSLDFVGQNITPDSVTIVSAKGSIDQGIVNPDTKNGNPSKIMVGGPGVLLVAADKDINLGNSFGIQSVGTYFNSGFTGENTDSVVIVSAGAKKQMLTTDAETLKSTGAATVVSDYFATLRTKGDEYSNYKASGEADKALASIVEARNEIKQYFDELSGAGGAGSISMVDSLIRSRKGDIYLLARGDVNVGKSSVSDSASTTKDTGITTTYGGKLNIYTGGDLNVNESRTMTFMGGDIVIWSDQGNINAGRGSKTALSSPVNPSPVNDPLTHVLIGLENKAPSVGSGVRASTYDPDGLSGPIPEPKPGDIYLFAPKGIIDAGEAGIAGGKITLGATQVLNAKNITFSAGSVGVPTGTDSSVSLGSLAGAGSVADSSKMIEQASTLGAAKEKYAPQTAAVDDFMSRWLDLRIISFDDDTDATGTDEDKKHDKDKAKKKKK